MFDILKMMGVLNIQRVIDRFHIGKINKCWDLENYYKVKTSRGYFVILESKPLEARETEKQRESKFYLAFGFVKYLM